MIDLTRPLGRILVLDIESAPDPRSVAIAGRGGQIARSALHRLSAATTMRAVEADDGSWSDVKIGSVAGETELPMLTALATEFEELAATRGTLVTYNGYRHDLPVLTRRAQANWAFDLEGIAAIGEIGHLDLLRDRPGMSQAPASLRDTCAGLGISMNHVVAQRHGDALPATVRKGQCDVVATFLLMLHEVAMRRRSAATLVKGWRALSNSIEASGGATSHLDQFRLNLRAGT